MKISTTKLSTGSELLTIAMRDILSNSCRPHSANSVKFTQLPTSSNAAIAWLQPISFYLLAETCAVQS